MTIINIKGGINKYAHHKQALFTFPNVARTTISNKQNWNCDRVIVREVVMSCERDEGEEGSEDDDNEGEEERQEAQQHEEPQGENDPRLNLNDSHKPNTHILR